MYTFSGSAARELRTYGWFLVDNGYLVAWDEPAHYMTVIHDPTATGFGTVGVIPPEDAHICMCDGITLTMFGAALDTCPSDSPLRINTTWRGVALSQLHAATPLTMSFSPRWLPPVLGLDVHGGPCALYMITNSHDIRAVLVRQSKRPNWLGIMAELAYEGPDLPEWK